MAMVNDGEVWDVGERAVQDLIDNAIMPISFKNRRHQKNHLNANAGSNCIYGPHLAGNFVFITGAQTTLGFSERVVILNDAFSSVPRTIFEPSRRMAPLPQSSLTEYMRSYRHSHRHHQPGWQAAKPF